MEKPRIAILLAVYEPNEAWLIELLQSLNAQTYPRLRLYVRDDASPTYPLSRLQALLEEHITAFPFLLRQNEVNAGSNATFGALVEDVVDEPLIAFCDQDDVWLPEKLEKTAALLSTSPLAPQLVCTNAAVINGEGELIADRMEQHRRRHVFLRGEGLAPTLIHRNFLLGCTMLLPRELALAALPFPRAVVHDHYLAFFASLRGAIDFVDEPLIRYRVYGKNQTSVMAGVATKEDYFNRRIEVFRQRIDAFCALADLPELSLARDWAEARRCSFQKQSGSFRALWRLRRVDPKTSWMELLVLRAPKPVFRFVIRLIQKGIL